MIAMTSKNGLPLFRVIIPAFPEVNIYSYAAKKTTALGPVIVATAANKMPGWRVEVIDENNCKKCPRDSQGLPDHSALQKENPASVVGFYCGISSTIERVWQLAEFYKSQKVFTIAGGRHAYYIPEETLSHNIDLVVSGEAEIIICQILKNFENGNNMTNIPGTYFLENGRVKASPPEELRIADLNKLPYPDFGLLRFAKIKYYPISRTRGCRMNCEFCSVKGEPHSARAGYLFNVLNWLVETRRARHFFLVDDRLEEDERGTFDFFEMIAQKYGSRLNFLAQARLEIAKKRELIEVMRRAGVRTLCIGFETPIDEELRAMRKGYLSSQMLEWTRILRRYFSIHGMFIVGYPSKEGKKSTSAKDIIRQYKRFIRKAGLGTIQILFASPIPGTDLWKRLERENRLLPLELVPWTRHDGNFVCFLPDNMSPAELQKIPMKIMNWFYKPFSFLRVGLKIIFWPLDCLIRGWEEWHRGWSLDILRSAGFLFIRSWRKKQQTKEFIKRLMDYSFKNKQQIQK